MKEFATLRSLFFTKNNEAKQVARVHWCLYCISVPHTEVDNCISLVINFCGALRCARLFLFGKAKGLTLWTPV